VNNKFKLKILLQLRAHANELADESKKLKERIDEHRQIRKIRRRS